jgi:hypothetical protein
MLLSLGGSLLTIPKAAFNSDHVASALNVAGHTLLVETFFITNRVENICLTVMSALHILFSQMKVSEKFCI